jgi:hypothetical protein
LSSVPIPWCEVVGAILSLSCEEKTRNEHKVAKLTKVMSDFREEFRKHEEHKGIEKDWLWSRSWPMSDFVPFVPFVVQMVLLVIAGSLSDHVSTP